MAESVHRETLKIASVADGLRFLFRWRTELVGLREVVLAKLQGFHAVSLDQWVRVRRGREA